MDQRTLSTIIGKFDGAPWASTRLLPRSAGKAIPLDSIGGIYVSNGLSIVASRSKQFEVMR